MPAWPLSAPEGSGSRADLCGDWTGSNSNHCLLLSRWDHGATRPAFRGLVGCGDGAAVPAANALEDRTALGLTGISCPALGAALQTDGGSRQAPSHWKITGAVTPPPCCQAKLHFYLLGKRKTSPSPSHAPRGQVCVKIRSFRKLN